MSDRDNTAIDPLSRRSFLAKAGTVGAAASVQAAAEAAQQDRKASPAVDKVPTAILGRTGVRVSRLAFGGSWDIDAEVIGVGIDLGMNYIDTAESYRGGESERRFAQILKDHGATGHSAARKKLWLVTKTHAHDQLEKRLVGCLDRLQQDYVDCFYMHQVRDAASLTSAETVATAERLKKSGKTRFFGFSTHDETVVECLNAAAKSGHVDVIMFRYDCHYYQRDDLMRAIDNCTKAKIGLIAMKTQVGGMTLPDKFDPFKKRGLNQHQAAIKAVASDARIHSICSEITTTEMVRQNAEAVASRLTLGEADAIKEHARLVSHLWCRGCDSICRSAAGAGASLAVADTLRFLMYHDHYGKRDHARELYAGLPSAQRDIALYDAADWKSAEASCPHGVPLARLMARAKERLA